MVGLISINYKIAPLDIREKFYFDSPEKIVFNNLLKKKVDCEGLMIISTCNRTEIYFEFENHVGEEKKFLHAIVKELVEFKKFTHHKSKTSLVGMEIPSKNGKHYPLPFRSEQKKANKYFDLMPEGVYSIGRAGSYLYGLDIDDCIWQSMLLKEAVLNSDKNEHPVLGKEYRFPEL